MVSDTDGVSDAPLADLQIGVDDAGRYVVLVKQLVQCVRIVKATAANNALATGGASLARVGLVMGTPFKLQRGARTSSPRVRCGTLQRCWSGLWKATVESMCWGKSRESRACGGCAQGGVRSRSNTPRCDDLLHWS